MLQLYDGCEFKMGQIHQELNFYGRFIQWFYEMCCKNSKLIVVKNIYIRFTRICLMASILQVGMHIEKPLIHLYHKYEATVGKEKTFQSV